MSISARNWAWAVRSYEEDGERRALKPGEKLTLLCLAELENAEYGYSFPSHETIAEWTCQSVRTVQTHLKLLEQIRAFSVEKRRSEKGTWLRNVYVLNVPADYRETDTEWQRLQG